jgi:hypothetical protein
LPLLKNTCRPKQSFAIRLTDIQGLADMCASLGYHKVMGSHCYGKLMLNPFCRKNMSNSILNNLRQELLYSNQKATFVENLA